MQKKTVFQMDRAGLFAGTTEAHESPLEPGVFIMPAGCVDLAPPDNVPTDRWPRWNGAQWELIHRPVATLEAPAAEDPVAKLRAFLDANPDVASLLTPAT
jgi:hypothetical protein